MCSTASTYTCLSGHGYGGRGVALWWHLMCLLYAVDMLQVTGCLYTFEKPTYKRTMKLYLYTCTCFNLWQIVSSLFCCQCVFISTSSSTTNNALNRSWMMCICLSYRLLYVVEIWNSVTAMYTNICTSNASTIAVCITTVASVSGLLV